jgi:hypothetical protein
MMLLRYLCVGSVLAVLEKRAAEKCVINAIPFSWVPFPSEDLSMRHSFKDIEPFMTESRFPHNLKGLRF